MANDINGELRNVLPGNIDYWNRVYATVAEANAAIPSTVVGGRNFREGKVVQIGTVTNFVEHHWFGGFTDANLVPKVDLSNVASQSEVQSIKDFVIDINDLTFDVPLDYLRYDQADNTTTSKPTTVTQSVNSAGEFTFGAYLDSTGDNPMMYFNTGLQFPDMDTTRVVLNFRTSLLRSVSPGIGIGYGSLLNPNSIVHRINGQLNSTFKYTRTAINNADANLAYNTSTPNVQLTIEKHNETNVYVSVKVGNNESIKYSTPFAPTGNILIAVKGSITPTGKITSYGESPLEKDILAKTDAQIAPIQQTVDQLLEYNPIPVITYDFQGYNTGQIAIQNGGAINGNAVFSIDNGLKVAYTNGSAANASVLLSKLPGIDLSHDKFTITETRTFTSLGTTAMIGLAFGDYPNGQYRAIGYRSNGALNQTLNLTSFTDLRAASSGYVFTIADVVQIEYTIDKKAKSIKVRTSKNGVWDTTTYETNSPNFDNIYLYNRTASTSTVKIVLNYSASSGGGDAEVIPPSGNYPSSMILAAGYGQSLSQGHRGTPPLSVTQKYNSIMFQGGLRPQYDTLVYTAYEPLIERASTDGAVPVGETPTSGLCNTILERIEAENGIKYNQQDLVFFGFNPGRGSTAVSGLIKGTTQYTQFITGITAAKSIADSLGKIITMPYVWINQGEADIDANTTALAYQNAWKQIRIDLSADVKAILGNAQPDNITLVFYQTSSQNARTTGSFDTPLIPNAQFDLCLNEPYFTMSNASFVLDYATDNVHLQNTGYYNNGVHHAIAIKRMMVDGIDWKPIHVTKVIYSSTVIELTFHVPEPPLVIDTVTVADVGTNKGFRVFKSDGSELTVTNVQVISYNKIRLTVSGGTVASGDYIQTSYNGTLTGRVNGARNNIRDSQSDKLGLGNQQLSNWMPTFKYTL